MSGFLLIIESFRWIFIELALFSHLTNVIVYGLH